MLKLPVKNFYPKTNNYVLLVSQSHNNLFKININVIQYDIILYIVEINGASPFFMTDTGTN